MPINRRTLLKLLITSGFVASRPRHGYAHSTAPKIPDTESSTQLTAALEYLAPFPAKQQIVQREYAQHQHRSPLLQRLSRISSTTIQQASGRISEIANWPIGQGPNYSAAHLVDGQQHAWIACYHSGAVYQIHPYIDTVTPLSTGPRTYPLDIAYDSSRRRLVVASADDDATMIVLDENGDIIAHKLLTSYPGQGISDGGAQGVALDAEGNYWFALSYQTLPGQGVVIKVDANTLDPTHIIKNVQLSNPNGIVTSEDGHRIFVFSDVGVAHEFNLDGQVRQTYTTVSTGYRGTVHGEELWTCAWVTPGRMTRVNLQTGVLHEFPCVDLANSIVVDKTGYVWVVGDAGISVSDREGHLIAITDFGAFTNGLSLLDNDVFFATYDRKLRHVQFLESQTFLPTIQKPSAEAQPATGEVLLD